MVNYTVKKAFKILEPRRTKERKEDNDIALPFSKKLQVIDPSHELLQQRLRPSATAPVIAPRSSSATSKYSKTSTKQSYSIHPVARHSNPELHTAPKKWSSTASVSSLDAASVSSYAMTSPTMDGFDDELDMLEYDRLGHDGCARRQSTGSSRAKSQQKLAKILGWNTSEPQHKGPRPSQSAETLVSPASTIRSPFSQQNPASWATDMTEVSTSDASIVPPRRKRSMGDRSNSVKSTSSRAETQPYDYQMRQFLTARPYAGSDKSRSRDSPIEQDSRNRRSNSPRLGTNTHQRQNSNPDVHKPLPTTPSFPAFPSVHPLTHASALSALPITPISQDDGEYSPIMELSAEEASVLLSQPEPTELPTDSANDRVELPGIDTVEATAGRLRSKSPTQARSASAQSTVSDFGPGHTLSVIEEEPWTTEDLAKFKVFELPAANRSSIAVTPEGLNCPGLSPSSSMSSRKLRLRDSNDDAELEDQTESPTSTDVTPTRTTPEDDTLATPRASEDEAEAEGEEIIVIYDHRVKSQNMDMNGRSFLSLDDDTEGDETDTEESVRRSWRSSIRNSSRNSTNLRNWPLQDGDERRTRRTSAETTKTAWTTNSEKTFVDSDFTGDLAKNMDMM